MNQIVTEGIVLTRTDYGEADRIITLLTPDHGKLRLLAKGVRKVKSKLAGGIELFSVSSITYIPGRGEIGTLVSTRLAKHYGRIVEDLDRTMLGYDLIKQFNKATEDHPEPAYFELLQLTFEALDDSAISLELIAFWFAAQLLRLGGHEPNLQSDAAGQKLQQEQLYDFAIDAMAFRANEQGRYNADHIKFLRLSFAPHAAKVLSAVRGSQGLATSLEPLLRLISQTAEQG